MLIAVTGAYGFIGSNLVRALNKLGYNNILAIDDLTNGSKAKNLTDCTIADYIDKRDFIEQILNNNQAKPIAYIFHQGACSDTTEQNGHYMMENNYRYSMLILDYAQKNHIPLTYASSAAVYGASQCFIEERQYEAPLNIYGYSKFLFDQMVRKLLLSGVNAPIVGLRYFNVYGHGEAHKGRMASVVLHNYQQYQINKQVQLFAACQGYASGMQMRDFVYIDDIIAVNLAFFQAHLKIFEKTIDTSLKQYAYDTSGIFNCGSGTARTFNDLALAVINAHENSNLTLKDALANNLIQYITFPNDLASRYQCYTQADLTKYRTNGGDHQFTTLESGIAQYVQKLKNIK